MADRRRCPPRVRDVKNFYTIRDECLATRQLWEDREFDAVDSSLFYSKRQQVEWKRPFEIVSEPKFIVDGVSRFDVKQGKLGNCWLMASIANLTLSPCLFQRVVPTDQTFTDYYAGIFHFYFWRFGTWIEVVVDDRLPTRNGKLVYLHSGSPDEFWSALLEKAYAKMFGSYEALNGGNPSEAMMEFTGGVLEMYNLKDTPPNFFQILYKAFERNSLMSCSINADPNVMEKKSPDGLIMGHAYSVTRVHLMNIVTQDGPGQLPMLRLRNPWGDDDTWNGPWSDKSGEWQYVPDSEKKRIRMSIERDGEFWISFDDFMARFSRIEVCNLTPDSLESDGDFRRWDAEMTESQWVQSVTAGGCRNYLDSFWLNPQFRITLTEVDEQENDNKCTVIISLIQKNRRQWRKLGLENLTIGYVIYSLPTDRELPTPLPKNFFKFNKTVARSPSFVNMRQVSSRFRLPPGSYCLVPSTYEPNHDGDFLLRVFSEKRNNMREYDAQVQYMETVFSAPDDEDESLTKKVMEHFEKLSGEDKEIDWLELKEILDQGLENEALSKGGFSKDICRSMMALCDDDVSGRLSISEFTWLWDQVCSLKKIYHRFRESPQGRLKTSELKEALVAAGYQLNAKVLNMLARRYAGRDGKIPIDDFMMCAIKLNTMIDYWWSIQRDVDHTDKAEITLQQWVLLTVGC